MVACCLRGALTRLARGVLGAGRGGGGGGGGGGGAALARPGAPGGSSLRAHKADSFFDSVPLFICYSSPIGFFMHFESKKIPLYGRRRVSCTGEIQLTHTFMHKCTHVQKHTHTQTHKLDTVAIIYGYTHLCRLPCNSNNVPHEV